MKWAVEESEARGDPGICVWAIEMGYGHLRPAHAVAEHLGVPVLLADRPPLADLSEQRRWALVRGAYEVVSRFSRMPVGGGPARRILESVTDIPHLFPLRDLSGPTTPALLLDRLIVPPGLGRDWSATCEGLALRSSGHAPALAADRLGAARVFCLVTDSDLNRIWVPTEPSRSAIIYLAPSRRVVRRLRAYGVTPERIRFTGFPLPHSLLGGRDLPDLRRNRPRAWFAWTPRATSGGRPGRTSVGSWGNSPRMPRGDRPTSSSPWEGRGPWPTCRRPSFLDSGVRCWRARCA